MYMASRISGQAVSSILPPASIVPELVRYDYVEPQPASGNEKEATPISSHVTGQHGPEEGHGGDSDRMIQQTNSPGFSADSSTHPLSIGTLSPRSDYTAARDADIESSDDDTQQARFRLAAQAITDFPAVRQLFTHHPALDDSQPNRLTAPASQLVVAYTPNWPSDYLLPGLQGEVMGMVLCFASTAYGGVYTSQRGTTTFLLRQRRLSGGSPEFYRQL